jgi:hypothetical protein
MFYAWGAAALMFTAAASAEHVRWLTVQGDTTDIASDVVQVAPETITVFDSLRTMEIRVSRSEPRNAYDGGKYRSYQATAEINCGEKRAMWKRHEYFSGPLWTGASRKFDQPTDNLPTMLFRSMSPNPVQRIVHAACSLQAVKTG